MADHIDGLSGQVLAYMGDAVFEEAVREKLVREHDLSANNLHKLATSIVNAGAQAKYARAVEGILTENEAAVMKRGRNSDMGAMPKHALAEDYRHATGFEALLGYLHLKGEKARAQEIIEYALKSCPPVQKRAPRPYKG